MPPNETTPEANILLENPVSLQEYETKYKPEKAEIVTVQPERKENTVPVVEQKSTIQNMNNECDCITCITMCCNFVAECWFGIFACSATCFDGCANECVNGICEGCGECLQGCGECCVACTECCK